MSIKKMINLPLWIMTFLILMLYLKGLSERKKCEVKLEYYKKEFSEIDPINRNPCDSDFGYINTSHAYCWGQQEVRNELKEFREKFCFENNLKLKPLVKSPDCIWDDE